LALPAGRNVGAGKRRFGAAQLHIAAAFDAHATEQVITGLAHCKALAVQCVIGTDGLRQGFDHGLHRIVKLSVIHGLQQTAAAGCHASERRATEQGGRVKVITVSQP